MKKLMISFARTVHFYGLTTIVLGVVTLVRFMSISPAEAGPRVHFVNFALLYALFFSLLLALRMKGENPLHFRKNAWVYASSGVIAAAPVMLLGLSSLNQLSIWDVILILIIESSLYFYISYQFRREQ